MSLLEARNLSKQFGRQAPYALKNINLTLNKGEAVAIVGESGSGKTTLARILLGLDTPSEGTVLFKGLPIATSGRRWRAQRRELQMIPQHASGALDPRMTVRGHFSEVIKAHHLATGSEHDEVTMERLREVNLRDEHARMYPRRLSGGQQQRVVIARGLLVEPTVLISDEPTSALDPLTQEQVIALLATRCVNEERLFGIITHDLRVARKICDRILVMRRGEIVEDGPAHTVFDSPQHPYTQELLEAITIHPAKRDDSALMASGTDLL
ncbi:ABC transporter ATP-binding protein [Microbacterium forte]|uniref:ABC transporter ATP-binding protein n=1 Tax=Microbacterium forte TaxID=2982533 RepID=UPI0028930345|nr:ABC transporter ATP-binding protein [Microbacterium sp. A(2022)]